jgi:hypothetical protein
MDSGVAHRLDLLGIQLLVETQTHFVFAREDCIALVERREAFGSIGSIGSTGMMTPRGLAYLVWRDGQAWLASKGCSLAADEAQVAAIRRFSRDLASALQ